MENIGEDACKLLHGLATHSRVSLGLTSTPIEKLTRISATLGIDLYAKRDDSLTLGMGGNKIRQLEFYLGPAMDMAADTVLITGAVQSNFVRSCAAAARKLGLRPVVQLERRVAKDDLLYNTSGNVLINHLFGAEIHYFPEGENEAAADANLDTIAETLKQKGENPYVIHLGVDHAPLGGLGYALAAAETFLQFQNIGEMPDHIIIPSGSGLTHAGFLCGARAIGWDIRVHGICVRRSADQQHKRVARRASEIDSLLGKTDTTKPDDILVTDAMLAPGYGQMNAYVSEAITMGAHSEGLLLDPVYSGRAFAGLIDLVRTKVIGAGNKVAFIHTGGLPALFAYQNELS